jgi:hypothetical protein
MGIEEAKEPNRLEEVEGARVAPERFNQTVRS